MALPEPCPCCSETEGGAGDKGLAEDSALALGVAGGELLLMILTS